MADSSRDIWESGEWASRRAVYRKYRELYDGTVLKDTQQTRDRETGTDKEKFPLRLNVSKLACDLHRDIARGVPLHDDPLIVRAVVDRSDIDGDRATELERIINDRVWIPSSGGAIQQEGLLSMNIYGGAVYQLRWEPWDRDLPLGLSVRFIRNPGWILPKWDHLNPWRLLEVHFGYEISPEMARLKYNVDPKTSEHDNVIYMEHWTPKSWRVTVDDKVPVMDFEGDEVKLEGVNAWGFVPFMYIPHERTTELFGDSQTADKKGLVEEINSRAVTISDLVRQVRPGLLYGTDVRVNPIRVRHIQDEGHVVGKWLDLGGTPGGAPGSRPPALNALPIPDVPEFVGNWPMMLLQFWMIVERISPAALGLDDTRSGRITGPAVAQRMWSSVAHAVTERINFTTAKKLIDKDILAILSNETIQSDLGKITTNMPDISQQELRLIVNQNWPPMIPLDRQEHHKELVDRIREKAASPFVFLKEFGVDDVEGEMQKILEWAEELAKIEAMSQPKLFGDGNEPKSQPQDQGGS